MIRDFFKIFILVAIMFASSYGGGSEGKFETFYEKTLKPSFERLKPLQDFAKKRQNVYIASGVVAIVVFALFVKYFKLLGAVVALLMIAGGVYYLKSIESAVNPYKKAFYEKIVSKIGDFCCGYEYINDSITQEEIIGSKLFSPKIKDYKSDGIYLKEGVKFGYANIDFDTNEDESVERFAENVFKGFVIVINQKNDENGVIVSQSFKERVADIDPEFNAFFSPLPRGDKKAGFEIYGKIDSSKIPHLHMLSYREIALAFTKEKTYIYYYYAVNPLSASVYEDFSLKDAKSIESTFKEIDSLVEIVKK